MMERVRSLRRLPWRGRWVVETMHKGARSEVIVKPDSMTKLLEVITAYGTEPLSAALGRSCPYR